MTKCLTDKATQNIVFDVVLCRKKLMKQSTTSSRFQFKGMHVIYKCVKQGTREYKLFLISHISHLKENSTEYTHYHKRNLFSPWLVLIRNMSIVCIIFIADLYMSNGSCRCPKTSWLGVLSCIRTIISIYFHQFSVDL